VTGANAAKWFDNYRGKVHAQAISGLGDQAYYDAGASVSVLQDNAYVRIAVGIPDNLGVEETLAREALPNM
jgi:lipopolysaccharide export system protein LptA